MSAFVVRLLHQMQKLFERSVDGAKYACIGIRCRLSSLLPAPEGFYARGHIRFLCRASRIFLEQVPFRKNSGQLGAKADIARLSGL